MSHEDVVKQRKRQGGDRLSVIGYWLSGQLKLKIPSWSGMREHSGRTARDRLPVRGEEKTSPLIWEIKKSRGNEDNVAGF